MEVKVYSEAANRLVCVDLHCGGSAAPLAEAKRSDHCPVAVMLITPWLPTELHRRGWKMYRHQHRQRAGWSTGRREC